MFKMTLSPCASDRTTEVAVSEDAIIVDGARYDMSALPDNSECDAELPAVGKIRRVDGVIEITILYFYDGAKAESNQSTDINDYIFEVESGPVPSPIVWRPVMDELEMEGSFDA